MILLQLVTANLSDLYDNDTDIFFQREKSVPIDKSVDAESEKLGKQIDLEYCQQQESPESLCLVPPQLSDFAFIHESVDLREAGLVTQPYAQGSCGMCWAIALASALENAILVDSAFQNEFWRAQLNKLNLSSTFLGVNMREGAFNQMCGGGESQYSLPYIAQHFQTVDLQENYPYENVVQANLDWTNRIPYPAKIVQENYNLPFVVYFHEQKHATAGQKIYMDWQQKWGFETMKTIKSYLNRGIAVLGAMHTHGSKKLRNYDGSSYIEQKCEFKHSNHVVLIAGYGNKDGAPVWLVKNSWGEQWGAGGFMYVPQGNDDFCMEHEAIAMTPLHYDEKQGPLQNIGDQTQRAGKQLDKPGTLLLVENTGVPEWKFGRKETAIIVCVAAGVSLAAVFLVVCIKCRGKKKAKAKKYKLIEQHDPMVQYIM